MSVLPQMIGIRTSALEEKATACSLISCYIDDLGEAFAPYVEETAKIMVPLLKYLAHEGTCCCCYSIFLCMRGV